MKRTQFRVVWRREGYRFRRYSGELVERGPTRHTRTFGRLDTAERFVLVLLGRGPEAYGLDPKNPGDREQITHYEEKYARTEPRSLIGEPAIETREIEVGEWVSA